MTDRTENGRSKPQGENDTYPWYDNQVGQNGDDWNPIEILGDDGENAQLG